ncbi:hypothetical protein KR026_003781, partial [Drosophila bipectinata]
HGQRLERSALGFFSVDRNHKFHNDESQLRIIKMPGPMSFPLNVALRVDPQYLKLFKHFYGDYLDPLLQYMIANPTGFFAANPYGPGLLAKVPLITQMEVIQELMCTPYNRTENWRIVGSRYRNTSYMCIEVPGGPINPNQQRTNNFEAVLKLLMHHGGELFLPNRLQCTAQYKNVFLGELDEELSILYDAPMGGAYVLNNHADSPLTTLSNLRFMDFRVGRCVLDDSGRHTSACYGPMEALSWWSECYLKKMKQIYVGCGYPVGLVDRLKEVTASSLIPENVRKIIFNFYTNLTMILQRSVWSPSICHKFLEYTLRKMMDKMEGTDDPCVTFEFNYVAEKRKIYVRKEAGNRRCPLLPQWYIRMMEK